MTRRKFISDSTPLIALARIEELDLVPQIFGEVLIPEAVYGELVEARGDAPGAQEVAEATWLQRVPADPQVVAPLLLLVDRGEAEAIAVAQRHPGSLLLTDDRKARRVAKTLGVEVQGCLGILLRARRQRLISAIQPLSARLQAEGWRISEKELEEFLRQSGE
jgi:hypothetical protein